MIKSMTAFAAVEKRKEKVEISIEIRSYNSKYLDIALRISHGLRPVEDKIKALVSKRILRGRVEIAVQLKNGSDETGAFEVDTAKARSYHDALVLLKDMFGIRTEISTDLLVGAGNIIKPCETDLDMEGCWPIIKECLDQAMDGLDAMRKTEGDNIAHDFELRLDFIEKSVDQIKEESGNLIFYYQERLKNRISALTKNVLEIDPGRIAQEAAFLADKSDISEEIVRVGSHIKQFRSIMYSAEPAGRKLNFLLQELNREFNTIGSKAGNAGVSHMVVDVKSELEKIREQVQNVE